MHNKPSLATACSRNQYLSMRRACLLIQFSTIFKFTGMVKLFFSGSITHSMKS
jgi:hypothetical protein